MSEEPKKEEDLVKGGAEEIETLLKEQDASKIDVPPGHDFVPIEHAEGLKKDLEAANKRIDEQAALFHSMLEYMDNMSFQIQSLCLDMQTRVRVIKDRNPITSAQHEIVDKSKREANQPVSS